MFLFKNTFSNFVPSFPLALVYRFILCKMCIHVHKFVNLFNLDLPRTLPLTVNIADITELTYCVYQRFVSFYLLSDIEYLPILPIHF